MSHSFFRKLSPTDAFQDSSLLRILVDTLPDHVYVKDTEGRYVLNNLAHAMALGAASPEEAAGKSDFDFYPKELAERYRADEQEIIRSGRPLVSEEQPSVDGEGNRRWHSTTKVPLRDGNGGIVGLLGVTRDVTEHKEAEEALRQSEKWFRSVVHNSTEILKIVDPDGTLKYASPSFERVLGYDPEEAIGMNLLEYVHPDDLPHVLEETEKALGETGVGRNVAEYRFRHEDGSWRYMESVGTYLLDDPAVRGVVVNARDVTERKQVEEELRGLQREYEELVDSVDAIIWKGDARPLRFTFVSHQAETILGYPAERWTAEPSFWLDHIHPEDREWAVSFCLKAIDDKRSHSFDYRMIGADGRVVWLRDIVHVAVEGDVPTQLFGVMIDITERKEAERKFRENEERFRSLIQNASDVITILAEDGTIRYESPAVERVLGYSPEERVGKNAFDYLHPDDADWSKSTFAEALDHPGEVRPPVGFRLRHKDGSWRHMETTRTNLLEDSAVNGVVANSRDVTERKQAEEKIRESEERYRAVMEQSAEAIWLFDPDTKQVLESNTAFQEMLGYTAEELSGMTNYDFVAHSREDIDSTVWHKVQEGKDPPHERKYRRADGTLLDVEVKGTLISYGGKEVVCSVARDLTERKEAEKALRESEERYRQLVDLSPEMVAVHSDGKWLYINDAGARLVGAADPEELIGKPVMDLVHPDFREIVRSRHSQLERGESNPLLEQKLTRPDGQVVDVEVASAPLTYQGKPAYQSLVRDITERKKAEKALRESEERFRSAFEDSPIGVALVDLDGQRFRVNRALCEMLGYSEDELLCAYLEHVHPDDREISSEQLRQLLEEGTGSYALERRYLHADGHVVWNLTSVSLIQDSQGDPSHLVCLHQDITERKELEERLRHQAFYDSLTDLPNRILFLDRLGHALDRAGREGGSLAVLLADLDDFKIVNDSLGHDAGNDVLVEVAKRLRRAVRPGDTVGRIFGDEFAILLEAPAGMEEANLVTQRIEERLREPFEAEGQEVYVSPSIGISLAEPAEDEPKEVLRHADLAMYEAKSRGKSQHQAYDPGMDARANERMNLERDLRQAIEREEFEIYYQPKVLLETGAIAGVEALLRWQHPERGLLEANQFIELAEKSGLINEIGPWVLKESCRQLKEWQERYLAKLGLPFGMCVNLSAEQIRQHDLVDDVAGVLRDTGLDPSCLMLEISERTAKEDTEETIGRLRELKDLGVELAIDDFGTGYCSLVYLEHSLLDFLKIDRLFVHSKRENDPEGYRKVISAMTSMAHSLDLAVIVEGVETEEQWAKLKEIGCEMAQGRYFAKPLPSEAIEPLLREGVSS